MSDRYPLPQFRISKKSTLARIIECYPLATVITGSSQPPRISLLPLVPTIEDDEVVLLTGHLDRNNPQAVGMAVGNDVSFVFRGPDAYASPDLYPKGHLPGWLYLMVHGHGTISRILDREQTLAMLASATDIFGSSRQQYRLSQSPKAVDHSVGGILAFSIKPLEISGIAKFAQDKGKTCADVATRYLQTRVNDREESLLARILGETLGDS